MAARIAVGMIRNTVRRRCSMWPPEPAIWRFLLCRMLKPARVVGIDLSANMLAEASAKAAKKGLSGVVGFSVADCLALPFADGEFDAATVAYGVRNFEHLEQGYAEMWRVLRPGGVLCVIELSTPRNPLAAAFYRFYTRRVIPLPDAASRKTRGPTPICPKTIAEQCPAAR